MDILKTQSADLTQVISHNLQRVTDALYAAELITQQTKDEMLVLGLTDYNKASKLVSIIVGQLETSKNPKQYLGNVCHVLDHVSVSRDQRHQILGELCVLNVM